MHICIQSAPGPISSLTIFPMTTRCCKLRDSLSWPVFTISQSHTHHSCWLHSVLVQVAEVKIPDVNPSYLPRYGLFSMAAGDFLDVYSNEGSFTSDTLTISHTVLEDTICSSHCVLLDCVSIQKQCTRLMRLFLSSFLCGCRVGLCCL